MGKSLKHLKTGYTTGACAAAASRGAALMLSTGKPVKYSTILLPDGSTAIFELLGQKITPESASCFVIKDAGDDPDITHGANIYASVSNNYDIKHTVIIEGGTGVGKVTKPGLAIPPGEWAINPVPRKMIIDSVKDLIPDGGSLRVSISIPNGEELAKKTLNYRLGIVGGLSILGTTGIVRPVSAKAWTDTIDASLDVAKACHSDMILLSTGRTSESAAQKHLHNTTLNEEGCIMMGDHVAYSLRACILRGFNKPLISCQFAKLFKIACGYENTHAAASELDLKLFAGWVEKEQFPKKTIDFISNANTAREIIEHSAFEHKLIRLVCRYALHSSQQHAPGINPVFLLADYHGNIVFNTSDKIF